MKPACRPDGLWVLEGQCGDCGSTLVSKVAPVALDGPRIRETFRRPICRGHYQGRPKNLCGWTLTWVWLLVPTEAANRLRIDPMPKRRAGG